MFFLTLSPLHIMGGNCNAAAALMKFGDFDTFVLCLFKTRQFLKCKTAMAFFFLLKLGYMLSVCAHACMRVY